MVLLYSPFLGSSLSYYFYFLRQATKVVFCKMFDMIVCSYGAVKVA